MVHNSPRQCPAGPNVPPGGSSDCVVMSGVCRCCHARLRLQGSAPRQPSSECPQLSIHAVIRRPLGIFVRRKAASAPVAAPGALRNPSLRPQPLGTFTFRGQGLVSGQVTMNRGQDDAHQLLTEDSPWGTNEQGAGGIDPSGIDELGGLGPQSVRRSISARLAPVALPGLSPRTSARPPPRHSSGAVPQQPSNPLTRQPRPLPNPMPR